MSIRKDTTLGDWLNYAKESGRPYGEETERLFVRDAKMLITTWAGEKTYGSLADYAYRQYDGLLGQYYRPRWEKFFREMREISDSEWYQLAQEFLLKEDFEEQGDTDRPDPIRQIDQTLKLLQKTE